MTVCKRLLAYIVAPIETCMCKPIIYGLLFLVRTIVYCRNDRRIDDCPVVIIIITGIQYTEHDVRDALGTNIYD